MGSKQEKTDLFCLGSGPSTNTVPSSEWVPAAHHQPGHDVVRSPVSSGDVKHVGSCKSTLPNTFIAWCNLKNHSFILRLTTDIFSYALDENNMMYHKKR